jgi:hypothetical protein
VIEWLKLTNVLLELKLEEQEKRDLVACMRQL